MNYPELRDYQVEGVLRALGQLKEESTLERPRVLIIMGNPDMQGSGKSRMIQSLLESKGVDVEVVTFADLPSKGLRPDNNWETVIVDECREMTQAMIDSLRTPHSVSGFIETMPYKANRVATGKGKRSRLNREQRWR
jgi:hypothetical protein